MIIKETSYKACHEEYKRKPRTMVEYMYKTNIDLRPLAQTNVKMNMKKLSKSLFIQLCF